MKRLACIAVCAALPLGAARASVTFTFDDPSIPVPSQDTSVSPYMTGLYGSAVYQYDGRVVDNSYFDPDWTGKSSNDAYLEVNRANGDMEIVFAEVPISAMSADAYVFGSTSAPSLVVSAYDSTYNASGYDEEDPNPSALVGSWTWDASAGTEIPIDIACFDRPVSLLVFSDSGVNEIGIDNLTVTTIPAPGAFLLTLLGLGIVRGRPRNRR